MLTETLTVAVVTALATIAGSLVTGVITFLTVRRQDAYNRLLRHHSRALADVAAFHRLEALYVEALAEEHAESTPTAIKLRIRAQLRDQGHDTPSYAATALRSEKALRALSSHA